MLSYLRKRASGEKRYVLFSFPLKRGRTFPVSPATKLMSAKLYVEWPDGRTSDVAISRILKVKKSEKDLPVNARFCPPVIGDHVLIMKILHPVFEPRIRQQVW